MAWLAWRTLRWHPGSLMGTLVTLVVAATAVGALWFVVDSTDRQEVPVERYAGVPLVVGTSGGGISPGLAAAVDALFFAVGADRGGQEAACCALRRASSSRRRTTCPTATGSAGDSAMVSDTEK